MTTDTNKAAEPIATDSSTPETYVDRMIRESVELGEKIANLEGFLNTPIRELPDNVTFIDIARLMEQRVHMLNYKSTLDQRISATMG